MSVIGVKETLLERARKWETRKKEKPIFFLPSSEEEIRRELRHLRETLRSLSGELARRREEVTATERKFLSLAQYKNLLERQLVPVTVLKPSSSQAPRAPRAHKTLTKEEKKLMQEVKELSPEKLKKLKEIKI